jgi:hypothetical protein
VALRCLRLLTSGLHEYDLNVIVANVLHLFRAECIFELGAPLKAGL